MMIKSKKLLSIFGLGLLLGSCALEIEEAVNLKKGNFFFSTDQFFSEEEARLTGKKGFTKFVDFNGAQEIIKLDTLNLAEEFVPFKKTDINKVIWSDQYRCDTIINNQTIRNIKCTTSNSKLKTKLLNISYQNGKVDQIDIECKLSKMLLQTSEYLTYKTDNFYQVRRIQKLKSGKVDSTLVKVTF